MKYRAPKSFIATTIGTDGEPPKQLCKADFADMKQQIIRTMLENARMFHAYVEDHESVPKEWRAKFDAFIERESMEPGSLPRAAKALRSYDNVEEEFHLLDKEALETFLKMAEKRLNEQLSIYWNNKAGFTIILPCSNMNYFEHEKTPCPEAFYDSVLSLFHNTFGHRADAFLTDDTLYTAGRTLKKCAGGSYEYNFFNFEESRDLLRYVHNLTEHSVRFDERTTRYLQ